MVTQGAENRQGGNGENTPKQATKQNNQEKKLKSHILSITA
jgi:hypothetical protein